MPNALLTTVVASLLLLFHPAAAIAQTAMPCLKIPFQATGHKDVSTPLAATGIVHLTVGIQLGPLPSEIQYLTIRLKNNNNSGANLLSTQITITLAGKSITHGIEL